MVEVPENFTPKKKNIKVPMQNTPLKIGPFWAVPLEKMERWKDANWLTPSEMTLVTPIRKFHSWGGVDIKWNDPGTQVELVTADTGVKSSLWHFMNNIIKEFEGISLWREKIQKIAN